MSENDLVSPLNPLFVELLRCPLARRENKQAEDPGHLRIVSNSWLVCDESGMKYPIRNGIPIMLIEEGLKWREVAESDLPIPPPAH